MDMNPFKVWSISFGCESTEWANVRHLPASCCGIPTFLIYLECTLFAYLIRTHPFRAFSPVTSFTVPSLILPTPQNYPRTLSSWMCCILLRGVALYTSISPAGPCSVSIPSHCPYVLSSAPCTQWISMTSCTFLRERSALEVSCLESPRGVP